jgi:hypothetical protein
MRGTTGTENIPNRFGDKGKRGVIGGQVNRFAPERGHMPCTMRVEFPGAIYHMMDCGDRWELSGLIEAETPVAGRPHLDLGVAEFALS